MKRIELKTSRRRRRRKGIRKNIIGVWYVQMQRTMSVPGGNGDQSERVFQPGDYLPMSFAVWNGSTGDRDGKKNISIWQKLLIE